MQYTDNYNLNKPDTVDYYNIQDFNDNSDVIDAELSKKSERSEYSAVLNTTWSGDSAPYTQTVNINGILSTDTPHITPVYSNNTATAKLEQMAWFFVSKAVAGDNYILFTCFDDKPTQELTLQIEVIR